MTIAVYDQKAAAQFTATLDFFSQYLAVVMHNGAPRYKNLGEVTPPAAPVQKSSLTPPQKRCIPCGR